MSGNENILIVDNRKENIRFLTQQVLHPAGYQVSVAPDGEQGLREATENEPDLIIMDLNIPRLGGLQVLQALRENQSDVPVILITFHGSEEAAVQAFRLGASDYIIKPYDAETMQRSVERLMTARRLRKERDRLAESLTYANRQVERRLKELSILASVGKSVTALLDEDRLLTRMVEAAVYVTSAEEGLLLLVDEESGDLYLRAARGLGEKYAHGFRLKVQDSLAGQVLSTGKPLIITGSRQEDRFKVKTGYLVKSLLHVPIKVGDSVIGVLSVDHMIEDRKFDNDDLYLLSVLADYAAIAIENGRLHRALQARPESPAASPLFSSHTEISPQLDELLENIKSHRQEIQSRIEAGGTILSSMRGQVDSLDIWMDGIASQAQTLAQLDELAGEVSQTERSPAFSAPVVQEKVDVILDSLLDGVLVVDQEEQIVMVNRVAEAILGSDLLGKSFQDACDDPRWAKTYRIVKTATQLEPSTPGSELSVATTPLTIGRRALRASFRARSPNGEASDGMVVVLRDITVEREAQRAKDSFVSSVSQELRTPTTSIVGYAELLLGGSIGRLGEMQVKFLNRIRANADRIGSQLGDLVSMATIDSRQLEIKAQVMDLVSVIREASSVLNAQMAKRGQVLETHIEPQLPYVRADPDAVYHILTSLLRNAHHCSPKRSLIVLRAEKMQQEQETYALISITDAGGGIPPNDHKKVFNRYYRADNPIVPGLGDPGVGLPIVKVLVEAHGGRVWVDSIEGIGSTFTVILPIQREASEVLEQPMPAS